MSVTVSGVANFPSIPGAAFNVSDIVDLATLAVDGYTLGTLSYIRSEAEFFQLVVSDADVDHETVEAVSGYDDLRWVVFAPGGAGVTLTGDVTGTTVDGEIDTTVVDVPAGAADVTSIAFSATDTLAGRSAAGPGNGAEIPCTATGRSIIAAASVAAARTVLAVDILKAGTALTNADQTLQPATDAASSYTQSTALTANRAKTLGVTSVVTNTIVQILRRDTANFTLAIVNGGGGAGTLLTFGAAPATAQGATFYFDGTNWNLLNFLYVSA